ncbi:hypothetical protein PMAYCL1PPCAC_25501, partial [Pristionchus mayeri]
RDSNFVVRLEIENADSFVPGTVVESAVFNDGGFEWKVSTGSSNYGSPYTKFLLSCESKKSDWKCETNVEFHIHGGRGGYTRRHHVYFDEDLSVHSFDDGWPMEVCIVDNKHIVEFRNYMKLSDQKEASNPRRLM